jgi:hypothetical protein
LFVLTAVEFAREESSTKDSQQENTEEYNDHQVSDAGDGVDKRNDRQFKSFISGDESQRP